MSRPLELRDEFIDAVPLQPIAYEISRRDRKTLKEKARRYHIRYNKLLADGVPVDKAKNMIEKSLRAESIIQQNKLVCLRQVGA